jgi:hypothetical protein
MSDALASGHDDLPSFRRYPYKGRDDFLAVMDYERSLPNKNRIFLITNINQHQFELDFLNTQDRTFSRVWKEYLFSSQLLSIKMTLRAHERAGWSLADLIIHAAEQQMGNPFRLINEQQSDITLNTGIKRGDETLIPLDLEDREYPSVVIEVGLSETLPNLNLNRDVERWVRGSDGGIKAVITIDFKRDREMVIRRWCLESNVPVVKQETTVTRTPITSTTQITNAPFIVPFDNLYLREVTAGTNEGDIQITNNQLHRLAEDVWGRQ